MKTLKLMMYAVIATAIASLAQAQDNRTIRIATEGAFPPWNAVDTSGTIHAFDSETGARRWTYSPDIASDLRNSAFGGGLARTCRGTRACSGGIGSRPGRRTVTMR